MKLLKLTLFVLIFSLALLAGYLGYLYFSLGKSLPSVVQNAVPGSPNLAQGTVWTGTIVCLKVKPGDSFVPDGCDFGLKSSDGSYYVLLNVPDSYNLKLNDFVRVTGKIDDTAVIEHYDIKGVIQVNEIKPL